MKIKMTAEQKSYLKSIDSKNKRKKQKKTFKFLNETIENLFGEIDITHKIRYFLADGTNKTEIEPPIDFGEFFNNVFKNDKVEEEKKPKVGSSLAKEQLMDLTEPKEEFHSIGQIIFDSKKEYTLGDMEKCFNESRITKEPHLLRLKYDSFASYINSL